MSYSPRGRPVMWKCSCSLCDPHGASRGGAASAHHHHGGDDHHVVCLGQVDENLSKWKTSLQGVDNIEWAAHLEMNCQLSTLNKVITISHNFESYPRMLFKRFTDAKNSWQPEHVMIKGDQHLVNFNIIFEQILWNMEKTSHNECFIDQGPEQRNGRR